MTAKPFHRLKLLGSVEILSIARLAAETNSSRRFKQSNLYDTQVGSMSDLAIYRQCRITNFRPEN